MRFLLLQKKNVFVELSKLSQNLTDQNFDSQIFAHYSLLVLFSVDSAFLLVESEEALATTVLLFSVFVVGVVVVVAWDAMVKILVGKCWILVVMLQVTVYKSLCTNDIYHLDNNKCEVWRRSEVCRRDLAVNVYFLLQYLCCYWDFRNNIH